MYFINKSLHLWYRLKKYFPLTLLKALEKGCQCFNEIRVILKAKISVFW